MHTHTPPLDLVFTLFARKQHMVRQKETNKTTSREVPIKMPHSYLSVVLLQISTACGYAQELAFRSTELGANHK